MVARRGRSLLAVALAAAAAEVAFWLQLRSYPPREAASVLQPAMLLTSVAAALALYMLSSHWAAGGQRGTHLVRQASELSFGVYLAHPLIIGLLVNHSLGAVDALVPARCRPCWSSSSAPPGRRSSHGWPAGLSYPSR